MNQIWVESANEIGRLAPGESPLVGLSDRGFAYGDGLFETIRVGNGRPLFFAQHVQRLFSGLAQLGFPSLPWDAPALGERCQKVIGENEVAEGVLRLVISRGSGPRGFEPPEDAHPMLFIQARQTPDKFPKNLSGVCRATLAPWKVDPASPLCYVKHLSALDKVLAKQKAKQAGADEALFQNTNGHLTEATSSNLFLVIDGQILTPALHCGLLAGIARRLLLETLPQPIVEAEIPAALLAEATEAFLTNAVAGVRPLAAVDGRAIGNGEPGPATRAATEHYGRLCAESTQGGAGV
jgi:branched-chain amino acid aminotransferase